MNAERSPSKPHYPRHISDDDDSIDIFIPFDGPMAIGLPGVVDEAAVEKLPPEVRKSVGTSAVRRPMAYPAIQLRHGVNVLALAHWEALSKHRGVQAHVDEGRMVVSPSSGLRKKHTYKPHPKLGVSEMPIERAAGWIAQSSDPDELLRWRDKEKRPEVIELIDAQLGTIEVNRRRAELEAKAKRKRAARRPKEAEEAAQARLEGIREDRRRRGQDHAG